MSLLKDCLQKFFFGKVSGVVAAVAVVVVVVCKGVMKSK
jgi:hypothetical protein